MRTERNKILKQIHVKIAEEKEENIQNKMKIIEQQKSEPARMYKTIKQLRDMRPKNLILEDGEMNKTTQAKKQIEIVTSYFKMKFTDNKNDNNIKHDILPCEMETEFTCKEINKATKSMQNNRSAGIDSIHTEHIKYAPVSTSDECRHLQSNGQIWQMP